MTRNKNSAGTQLEHMEKKYETTDGVSVENKRCFKAYGLICPQFVDVDVAHHVDECGLAIRRRCWLFVGKVNVGDFVIRRTIAIPTCENEYSVPCIH